MMKLWSCLEELPGLRAVPAMWRGGLGDEFNLIRATFLRTTGATVTSFPCPHECGCTHSVVVREDQSIVGVCTCESWNCDDIALTPEEIGVLELNWTKLGRALAKAFDFQPSIAETDCIGVWQLGRVRGTATPVLLCVQHESREFTGAITNLAADLRKPFVLLAPTSRFMDVRTHTLLTSIGAEFFDLASHVVVTEGGRLQPVKRPGELFAEFAPKQNDAEENVARAVFRMVAEIESDEMMKPPTPITVLRLYCVEEMTADEIAAKCGCAKGTVVNRLRWIQQKTKKHPREFRRLAATFRRMEEDASDARAEYIHRKGMI